MNAQKTWYYVALMLAIVNVATGSYLVVDEGELSWLSMSCFAVGFGLLYITCSISR